MLTIKIKPIKNWTGAENKYPKPSQFRQTYKNTKQMLEVELSKLNVVESSVQLEMFINPGDLRIDGELRANAKPYKQGIVLSFSRIKRRFFDYKSQIWKNELQTLSYPCDAFDDWQDNLRAITLSLEALRKVERYGVFKYEDMVSRLALPSADGGVSDRQTAAEFVAKYSDYPPHVMADSEMFAKAYKQAVQKLHPDKQSGNQELFLKLQFCKQILEQN